MVARRGALHHVAGSGMLLEMDDPVLFAEDYAWFQATRARLVATWHQRAREVDGDGRDRSTLCRLFDVVPGPGHPSLPCSLGVEADGISEFLGSDSFDRKPVQFVRLLLFLLDEFTDYLAKCQKLLTGTTAKQPKLISVWTNRFAKHKEGVLKRHHPSYIFLDSPIPQGVCERARDRGVEVIDTDWLEANPRLKDNVDTEAANAAGTSVIVVPRLQEFLDEALAHQAEFIEQALEHVDQLAAYRSADHETDQEALEALLTGDP